MEAPLKQSKGSVVIRSRLGCLACRKKRKKCDEKRPNCSRCHRTLSHCVWPSLGPTPEFLVDADGSGSTQSFSSTCFEGNDTSYSGSGMSSGFTQPVPHLHQDKSPSLISDFRVLTHFNHPNSLPLDSSLPSQFTADSFDLSSIDSLKTHLVTPNSGRRATRIWEYAQDFGPRITWPSGGLASNWFDPEGAIPKFRQSVTTLTRRMSPEPLFQDVCYFYSSFLARIFYDYALIPGSIADWLYRRFNTSSTSKYAMLGTAALFRSDFERSMATSSLRACAKELYFLAVQQLTQDLEDDRLSPQEKLTGLVEVMNYEYHSGQLSDYYSHGVLGVPLVQAIIGSDTLDLLSMRGIEMFDVNFWAWCDILDSMATSKPTWFKYESDLERAAQPGTEESSASEDKGVEWIYGCPNVIAILLARTSSLRHAKLSEVEKQSQGAKLEQLIRNWQLRPTGAKESLLRVIRVGAQEVWRHSGILYVHHAILKSDPRHHSVKDSVKSIIKIASTIEPGGNPDSFLVFPYFIAGFYATTPKDRYILKSRLISSGNGYFLRNLASNLDELWKETDSTGRLTSWSEKQPPRLAF